MLHIDIVLYLYSVQYLHVLQDTKRYIIHPTAQVQTNSQVTDIILTERQRLKDDHLSIFLRFFSLPLRIGGQMYSSLNIHPSPYVSACTSVF